MTKEKIIGMVLDAPDTKLAEVEEVLTGRANTPQDRKLLNYRQAAEVLGVSKTSIRRLAKDGKLIAVETRLGRKRILSQSITDFVSGGNNVNG